VEQRVVVQRSYLAASRAQVWTVVSTLVGINAELWPLLRMTHSRQVSRLDPTTVPLDVPAFYSLFLLFGLLPVDYGDLIFSWLEWEHGFMHRSSTLALRSFQHERTLADAPHGCYLTDRLTIQPRWRFTTPFLAALCGRLFEHRHRRLRARFGGQTAPLDRAAAEDRADDVRPPDP
jgi:hypothetical protein